MLGSQQKPICTFLALEKEKQSMEAELHIEGKIGKKKNLRTYN